MSLLLAEDEFSRARSAVRAGTVTDELYAWLGRLVSLTQATRTLAPAPVPGGRWDDPEAVAETVQAWLEESLLRGGLLRAFDVCETPRALSRYLERALRNWLVSRSRRGSGPRLLERAAEMMGEDPFLLLRDAAAIGERWWGLATWGQPALYVGRDEDILTHAWSVGDVALLRYPSSQRSDPVLSTPELRRFLTALLERVGRGLSGQHLDFCFRERFAYAYAPASIAIQDAPDLSDTTSPADEVDATDAARVALGALTGRQLQVLMERPETTLEALAERLGVSRGTVDNEYRRALLKVREAASTDGLFDAVLENVLLMASERNT